MTEPNLVASSLKVTSERVHTRDYSGQKKFVRRIRPERTYSITRLHIRDRQGEVLTGNRLLVLELEAGYDMVSVYLKASTQIQSRKGFSQFLPLGSSVRPNRYFLPGRNHIVFPGRPR